MTIDPPPVRSRILVWLDAAATFAVLLVAGAAIWTLAARAAPKSGEGAKARNVPVPADPLSLAGAPTLGDPSARVVLIEFSDFECPFCGRAARDVLPQVERDYVDSGRVLLAFRNTPLTNIHRHAEGAALGAICSGQQGRFWEMRRALFQDQRSLDRASVLSRADAIGLERPVFEKCLSSADTAAALARDRGIALSLHVSGTPMFYIGTRNGDQVLVRKVLAGAAPLQQFKDAINGALEAGKPQ